MAIPFHSKRKNCALKPCCLSLPKSLITKVDAKLTRGKIGVRINRSELIADLLNKWLNGK